ncbi:hypothetical protein ACST14_06510 [Aquirufa sp. A-Brett2-15D]
MDAFFTSLGIISVLGLIISFFMEEPKAIDDIHKNLRKLGVSPLEKGQKSPYKLTITDKKGEMATYPLDQENFFFVICHFSPNCEAFASYMLELWCLSPFHLVLTDNLGATKKTETLGYWQWNGKQHTISLKTKDVKCEVIALILLHEIAHLRIHTLSSYAYVYNLSGKKIKSPYYGMSLKPHGPQFAAVFSEISRPTLEMKKLYSSKQKRHLTSYFQSPKKVHLTPLAKCGSIPVY